MAGGKSKLNIKDLGLPSPRWNRLRQRQAWSWDWAVGTADAPLILYGNETMPGMKSILCILVAAASISVTIADGAETNVVRSAKKNASFELTLPGDGMAQHDFLIAGEDDRRRPIVRMFLVESGKVAWTYQMQRVNSNGTENAISDIHRLANGDIVFAYQSGWRKIDKNGQTIFDYPCPKIANVATNVWTECHTAQPIGDDKVLFALNGMPLKVILYNIKSGQVEMEHAVKTRNATSPAYVHSQTRRVRMTKAGTYLVSQLDLSKVIEYDKDWHEIWECDAPAVWQSVRLTNGNTLFSGNNRDYIREVDLQGTTVWEVTTNDMPGLKIRCLQQVCRLGNGNTVFCNWMPKTGAADTVQVIEVTPQKKMVWALSQWRNPDLGPVSCIQLLDDPGKDEDLELMR
jgi:hypothetical protein